MMHEPGNFFKIQYKYPLSYIFKGESPLLVSSNGATCDDESN
jgi:hypothetical protein